MKDCAELKKQKTEDYYTDVNNGNCARVWKFDGLMEISHLDLKFATSQAAHKRTM